MLGEPTAARDEMAYLALAVRRMKRAGVLVTAEELDGCPTDAIVARVEHGAFDALVMGTRIGRGSARAVDGSVARSVMRRIGIPLFVVPESVGSSMPAFNRVLVGVDDDGSSGAALTFARRIARSDGVGLIVCSVLTSDGAAPTPRSAAYESVVGRGDAAIEIIRAAAAHDADCRRRHARANRTTTLGAGKRCRSRGAAEQRTGRGRPRKRLIRSGADALGQPMIVCSLPP